MFLLFSITYGKNRPSHSNGFRLELSSSLLIDFSVSSHNQLLLCINSLLMFMGQAKGLMRICIVERGLVPLKRRLLVSKYYSKEGKEVGEAGEVDVFLMILW